VAGVPERLELDGYAQIITLLIHREGDALALRVQTWLSSAGTGGFDCCSGQTRGLPAAGPEGRAAVAGGRALHES
jgi:hypothetical protein